MTNSKTSRRYQALSLLLKKSEYDGKLDPMVRFKFFSKYQQGGRG
jgi:hypothetical protein